MTKTLDFLGAALLLTGLATGAILAFLFACLLVGLAIGIPAATVVWCVKGVL